MASLQGVDGALDITVPQQDEPKPEQRVDQREGVVSFLGDLHGLGGERDPFREPADLGHRLGEPPAILYAYDARSDPHPAPGFIPHFHLDVALKVGDRWLVVAERPEELPQHVARSPDGQRSPDACGEREGALCGPGAPVRTGW